MTPSNLGDNRPLPGTAARQSQGRDLRHRARRGGDQARLSRGGRGPDRSSMVDEPHLSYGPAAATCPGDAFWVKRFSAFRSHERTVLIGHGQEQWESASSSVMVWGIKTRSGFTVESVPAGSPGVRLGADYLLTARLGPFSLREPVRVVAVVDDPVLCGFAYGTLDGHPVCGEEAFVVHRDEGGGVWLTLRSLTRPGRGAWLIAFTVVLMAQRWYRLRYLRALAPRRRN